MNNNNCDSKQKKTIHDRIEDAWLNCELPTIDDTQNGGMRISYITGLVDIGHKNGGWIQLRPVELKFDNFEFPDNDTVNGK